jgi:hypothetical protein
MQVAQRKLNNRFRRSGLAVGLLVCFFRSSVSFASVNGLSIAATYPTPQGYAFATLDHSLGLQAEGWIDSPGFMSHVFPQMHFSCSYEPFSVRALNAINRASIGISTGLGVSIIGAFVGVQAQAGDYGSSFTPFFTADIGGVVDTLTYSNTTSVNANSGFGIGLQLVPGFDLPLTNHLGLLVELPFKMYTFRNSLAIWSAVAGVRLKL